MNKFRNTGSVHDIDKSGRPRSVVATDTVQKVEEMLIDRPKISVRDGGFELGISSSSFHRAAREIGFRPYRPYTVVELSDDDFDRRVEFRSTFLAKLNQETRFLDRIILSDESEFRMNGVVNHHNCCNWAPSNPHQQIPISEPAPNVMVWGGLTSAGIIGPYFFDRKLLANPIWPC